MTEPAAEPDPAGEQPLVSFEHYVIARMESLTNLVVMLVNELTDYETERPVERFSVQPRGDMPNVYTGPVSVDLDALRAALPAAGQQTDLSALVAALSPLQALEQPHTRRVVRDDKGNITEVVEGPAAPWRSRRD